MISPGTSAVFTLEACSVHNAPDTVLLGLPLSWAATMMPFARTRVGHSVASGKNKPCWLDRLLACAIHGRGIHAARRPSRAHSRPLHHPVALEIIAWVNSLVHHLRNEALRWFWSDTTHTLRPLLVIDNDAMHPCLASSEKPILELRVIGKSRRRAGRDRKNRVPRRS